MLPIQISRRFVFRFGGEWNAIACWTWPVDKTAEGVPLISIQYVLEISVESAPLKRGKEWFLSYLYLESRWGREKGQKVNDQDNDYYNDSGYGVSEYTSTDSFSVQKKTSL